MKILSYIPEFFAVLPYLVAFVLGILAHKYCAPTLSKWAASIKAVVKNLIAKYGKKTPTNK